jgi:hypothetical protein
MKDGDSENAKTLFCLQLIRPENKRHLVTFIFGLSRSTFITVCMCMDMDIGDRH